MTVEAWSACSTVTASSGPPGRAVVDRAAHARRDPRERVELLDGRVRAVRDDRAAPEQRPERVRAVEPVAPEALGEVAVGRRVAELHRARDAELGEAPEVGGVDALRVLDPLAEAERRPELAGRLERVERLAVRTVADRVDRDGPAGGGRRADDLGELLAARDAHAAPVEHPGRLRAERAVHERLQVAEAQVVVAEAGPEAELGELADVVVREATARRGA